MSDFGEEDAYVAAVKGAILSQDPTLPIIDASHRIRPFDIGHAAMIAGHYYPKFPKGTVHLMAVDAVYQRQQAAIAAELNGHFFVTFNSGLLGLVDEKLTQHPVALPTTTHPTFPVLDHMVAACVALAHGQPLNKLGPPIQVIQHTKSVVKATKKEIVGQIIHVDHYGNLITNIHQTYFDDLMKILGGKVGYQVVFARERFSRLHQNYFDVEDGDCFVLFNSDHWLEIGINKGRASDLLGLKRDDNVIINFKS